MPPYRNLPAYKGPSGSGSSGPSSDYTRDVISRGTQAVKDRRASLAYGSPLAAQQAIQYRAATGASTNPQSPLIDEWLSSWAGPSSQPVIFGQSEDGKYAGFKTEGELKAAIEGAAQSRRTVDRSAFDQLQQQASSGLDQLLSDYDTSRRQAQRGESDVRANIGKGMGIVLPSSNESGVGYGTAGLDPSVSANTSTGSAKGVHEHGVAAPSSPAGKWGDPFRSVAPSGSGWQGTIDDTYQAQLDQQQQYGALADALDSIQGSVAAATQMPRIGADRAQQSAKLWQAEQPSWKAQNDYQSALDEWLASGSDKYLGQQEFAQQASNVPYSVYAQRAASDYGVDPNLAMGWFGTNEDNADWRTQRDAQSIAANGMPYSEFQSALTGLERDAAQAADQQTQAQETAMNDAIYQVTGQDGAQLAQAVNVTPSQLYDMVADPTMAQYISDIDAAVGTGDTQTATQAVSEILSQVGSLPEYRNLIDALYPDIMDEINSGRA